MWYGNHAQMVFREHANVRTFAPDFITTRIKNYKKML